MESSFSFVSKADREKYAQTIEELEKRDGECGRAPRSLRGANALSLLPAVGLAAPLLEDVDGHALAKDPAILDPYVRKGLPCMIRNYATALGWPALTKWASGKEFMKHHGEVPFKLTELAALHGLGNEP